MMARALKKVVTSPATVIVVYAALVIVATCQSYFMQPTGDGAAFTYYNNYVIFKQSFFHLLHHQELYTLHEDEYFDLYKYSPAFALFFGLFAWLPDLAGLLLWNLLNSAVLAFAIYKLPRLDTKQKTLALLFCSVEMMTSVQDSQSNALIAGLLILALGFFERDKTWQATLCIMLTVFIKIFGVLFLLLILFYRHKPKAILSTVVWGLVLALAPALICGPSQLLLIYKSWYSMLGNDHSISTGISVLSWINTWFHLYPNKTLVLAGGVLVLLATAAKVFFNNVFYARISILCAMLTWLVIFNHKAESPSFIIAVAGASLWYFSRRRSVLNTVLFALVFVFTSLSVTDVFPRDVRDAYFIPYVVKAVPCIFVWLIISWELLFRRPAALNEQA